MRIVVLGAGAIGSLFGGLLAQAHDVTLVAREPHVEAIRASGLTITGETERRVKLRATSSTQNLDPADVLLLTVKAHATQAAMHTAGDALGPETFVVSLQNGLGNVETLSAYTDPARIIAATTSHGSLLRAPGHVEHTGRGRTVLGPMTPPALPAHHELAQALTEAGLKTEVADDIQPELWQKAAINAAINPLTAITGLPNGALLELPVLRELMEQTAREAEAVARAEGVDVEQDAWVDAARLVAERTARNRSSMLQDVERGRPTEIDAICGRIAEAGQAHGVPVARNRTLHALVKGIEATLHYDR